MLLAPLAQADDGDSFAPGVLTVVDEGSALTRRPRLNFVGSGVSAVDDSSTPETDVTINGTFSAGVPVITLEDTTVGHRDFEFNAENNAFYLADTTNNRQLLILTPGNQFEFPQQATGYLAIEGPNRKLISNAIPIPVTHGGTGQTTVCADAQVLGGNAAGTALECQIDAGGSGTPGGVDTQVQFNDATAFGGDAGFTYNKTTDTATLGDLILSGGAGPDIRWTPTGGNTLHLGAEVSAGNTLLFLSNVTTGTHWLRFFGTDVQLPTLTNCNFLKTTPDGRLACPGAFSAGSIIFAGSSGGLIEDNANLFWDDTNNLLGIGTSTPNATLHLAGTQTTGVTYFSMLGTLQSSGSGQHNAFLNQATLDLQATPGPISAAYGLINLPIIASSLNDPDVTVVYGAFSRIDTNANYAGTIVNGRTFGAGNPATSGTNEITNFDQYYTDTITNGNGITSGTIQNRNLLANGSTAAAGLGGTITNYSLHVAVPSGSGAGTTTNQGLRITGNGGSGGSGTTTNWAIFSNSTANAALIGNLRLGSTVAPTALLHLDSADTTGATTEDVQVSSDAQTIALADGTTLGNQRQNQFIAPTINGVAAGGTETVTNAATVYINAAPSGSNITITNPYALWVDAGDVRSDGDLLLTGSAGPDIRWTPTNGDTLHLGAEVAAGNTLLFLSNVTTGTHWMRFFGTTIQLPNLTGCNKVITTADGRLACGDTIQTVCGRIFNVASTDDNINIFMWNAAVTVTEVGCHCEGTCTTTATFALENRAGTAMTHTTPTCSTGATSSVFRPVTAGGNLVAGQGLRYDTTNTPSPDGSDEYLLCTTVKL